MYGARNLGLTGWVSNLSDGSVEMEVQGPVAVIDHMIHNLQKGRWIRIEGMESKVIPVVRGERGFQVRGY
jgi:acylphosphatase